MACRLGGAAEAVAQDATPGVATVGVVHASPDAPSVTATSTAGPILRGNAALPAGTDYAGVGDGT